MRGQMSRNLQKLIEIINKYSPNLLVIEDITDELDLVEDLGMDSMSFVQLVIDIEAEFKIEFPDEKLLIDYIKKIKNLRECITNQLYNPNAQ